MSLRRKITLLFVLVNAITLALIVASVWFEGRRIKTRLDSDRGLIAARSADVLGLTFKFDMERELAKLLESESAGRRFDEFEAALAVSELSYWDEDPMAREMLDRAVLVRLAPLDVNRFNPRRRLIFERGDRDQLDKADLRDRLENAAGIVREPLADGSVLVYGMMDPEIARDWGFVFKTRRPEPFGFQSAGMVRTLLSIMVPGTLVLILIFYFYFSSAVLRPLAAAESAAFRISAGDYSGPLEDGDREDEIGRVAAAMNQMMAELEKYRDHMLGLVSEATERFREAEQGLVVAERLAAMGRIAAGIAHEINNPLGGILNAINRLGQADLSEERRHKYHELAEEAVRRIQATVQRVLEATPRGESRVEDVLLGRIVDQAAGLLAHRARSEGKELEVDVPGDLLVVGDAHELSQVFLNLLINALDASESGSRVTVRARQTTEEGILIEVIDQGAGMAPEQRERIFDLFYTTKPGNKGTGLGLGIVHNIVTGHGGRITVESEVGVGTRFEIVLPRRRPQPGGDEARD
ncbi:MAG: HAMP domain-containing histidine kinase [Planctomycetes bacterium]|nr:HAMP domain-containing histidine kinase [Planctomycetota bacterium]